MTDKIPWKGRIVAVQPRIRLLRSFDQRHHVYLGYALRLDGEVGDDERQFLVGVGKAAHEKWRCQAGLRASGVCLEVADPRLEPVEFYRVSQLRVDGPGRLRGAGDARPARPAGPTEPAGPASPTRPEEHKWAAPGCIPPPWLGVPPDLSAYRARGHRRLDVRTYGQSCSACIWGCRMAVEMIVDHWKPDVRRYRLEAFCYGPLSCSLHRPGPTRKVPGRRGLTWEEEDWVDKEATAHREPDD